MNKMYLLFTLMITAFIVQGQKPCCSPTQEFASFSNQSEFRSAHTLRPVDQEPTRGEWKTWPGKDGKEVRAWVVSSKSNSNVWVLMIHEWWGLNGHIQNEAETWSELLGDVNVMAVDMYDGEVASSRDLAAMLMQSVNEQRAIQILTTSINHIPSHSQVYSLGWCFGGGWSLQAAILFPDRISACVMYYGMPETNEEKLKQIQAPVLGIFASKDGWITPDVVKVFENQMNSLGKVIEIHSYDAQHAFANPSGHVYDDKAALEAKKKVLSFLNRQRAR